MHSSETNVFSCSKIAPVFQTVLKQQRVCDLWGGSSDLNYLGDRIECRREVGRSLRRGHSSWSCLLNRSRCTHWRWTYLEYDVRDAVETFNMGGVVSFGGGSRKEGYVRNPLPPNPPCYGPSAYGWHFKKYLKDFILKHKIKHVEFVKSISHTEAENIHIVTLSDTSYS